MTGCPQRRRSYALNCMLISTQSLTSLKAILTYRFLINIFTRTKHAAKIFSRQTILSVFSYKIETALPVLLSVCCADTLALAAGRSEPNISHILYTTRTHVESTHMRLSAIAMLRGNVPVFASLRSELCVLLRLALSPTRSFVRAYVRPHTK